MYIKSYKELTVWQKSMGLSKEIYKSTNELPKHELYGLTSQMRRSVISIPLNIAEGYKRNGLGEYLQFLSIADASAAELETQLLLTKELYPEVDFSRCEQLLQEVQKMLIVMIKKLRDKKSLNAQRSTLNANGGQAIAEILIAGGIFALVAAAVIGLVLDSYRATVGGEEDSIAMFLAQEGLDAARSIRDRTWLDLATGTHGLTASSSRWEFEGSSDTIGKFTRTITVEEAKRFNNDTDISTSTTGTPPPRFWGRTKKVTSTVTWTTDDINRSVSAVAYLTDWNVFDWHETNPTDFCAGTPSNVQIKYTGKAAQLELKVTSGENFVSGAGSQFFDTSDTDFNQGTFNDTTIIGSSDDASVKTATSSDVWRTDTAPSSHAQNINDVAFVSVSDGWAMGNDDPPADGDNPVEIARWDGSNWTATTSVGVERNMRGLVMIASNNGWAVGQNGAIIHYDGGSWKSTTSPVTTNTRLNGISAVAADDIWAVGDDEPAAAPGSHALVLHYDGTSWSEVEIGQTSPANSDLHDVSMVSTNDGWAVGEGGAIIRYTGTWANFTSPTTENLNGVDMVATDDGWAVGNSGKILRWDGASWTEFQDTGAENWQDVFLVSSTDGWIVGSGGAIRRWNGVTWSAVSSPTSNQLNAVFFVSSSEGWAVGNSNTIIKFGTAFASTATFLSRVFDSGASTTTWETIFWSEVLPSLTDVTVSTRTGNTATPDATWSAFSAELTDAGGGEISSPDSTRYIQYRLTLTTNDPTRVAPQVDSVTIIYNSPSTNDLNMVDFYSENDGWAVGEAGTILRYNGISWNSFSSPTVEDLNGLSMVSPTDAWAVGASGKIIRWNGSSWSEFKDIGATILNDVHMRNSVDGWIVGNSGLIFRWNGTDWATSTSPVGNNLNAVYVIRDNEAWIVGAGGTILRWNGTSWSSVTSPVTLALNDIHMIDPTNDIRVASPVDGWIVGNQGTILRWNGTSWSTQTNITNQPLNGISLFHCGDGILAGNQGFIGRWDEVSWSALSTTNRLDIHAIKMINSYDAWAVGRNGAIRRFRITNPTFASSGTFLSYVLDSGSATTSWETLYWSENLPAETDVTIATRSGNTATPDGTWSAFSAEQSITTGQFIPSLDDRRYMQYRATLTTNNTSTTSIMYDISLTYK